MDVIPDRTRYSVGDTATVLFASPFTDAEAWITVEREGLIEQRRLRLTSGSTTLKFPITEAFAPNAFVSILVARGRSAPPGPLDDPGRPTIRVGYAELRVTPEVKRLDGDGRSRSRASTARATRRACAAGARRARARGSGAKSRSGRWTKACSRSPATQTPDPIDLLYQPRGLGLRLASNLTTVAPQVPEGEKGTREPGGGGGRARPTSSARASRRPRSSSAPSSPMRRATPSATAKLPDNLTTFRVMAVAVTAGDRYGSGRVDAARHAAAARASGAAALRSAGRRVHRRRGDQSPRRCRGDRVSVHARRRRAIELAATRRSARRSAGRRGVEVRFPFRAHAGAGDSAPLPLRRRRAVPTPTRCASTIPGRARTTIRARTPSRACCATPPPWSSRCRQGIDPARSRVDARPRHLAARRRSAARTRAARLSVLLHRAGRRARAAAVIALYQARARVGVGACRRARARHRARRARC